MSDPQKPLKESVERISVPIKRHLSDDLPLLFSDDFVIRHMQDGMFLLSFFRTRPPLASTEEEVRQIKEVDAQCVAQILLTPVQMEKTLNAMNLNFARFLKSLEESSEKEAN